MVKLPMTSAALREGTITLWKAEIIAGACSPLSPEKARQAEAAVFPDAATLTPRALGDRIKAAAIAADPEAATRRREEAARTRRVEVDPPGPYGRWRLNPAALTGSPGGQEMIIDLEPLDGPCDHRHQAAGNRGWFKWTTPSGRSYLNGPTQYPD